MGSKSSSSQKQETETTQVGTEDTVIVGDLFQGKEVNVTQEFSEDVKQAFTSLLDVVNNSLSLTRDTGRAAIDFANQGLGRVSENQEFNVNPEASIFKSALPIAGILAVGVAAYFILPKKG